jgi:imidazole glycerol phosphate synthase glutamine amidotransferase subunit
MIGVVDYGAGNLRNVQAALTRLGARWRSVAARADLDGLGGVILPGVGQFGAASRRLREVDLFEPLREWIASDRPILGICLGMQLLFQRSDEEPDAEGLGVLDGAVHRLGADRLPHIGWAVVEPRDGVAGTMFTWLTGERFFAYFAHSYALNPGTPTAAAVTSCPPSFASAVRSGNIWGVQFHPEKSGALGHRMLAGFVSLATGGAGPGTANAGAAKEGPA